MLIGIRTLGALALSATTLPVVLAGIAPGLDRLAGMPPGVRLELAGRLERFDRLPDADRRAIRELDDALDRLDPDERQRYLDLMRRYGSWARGLDDEARRELEATPINRRLALIRDRLGPAGAPESPGLDPVLWVRADTFNPVPLYDAAALLRAWVALDERDRRRVESARTFDEKLGTLRQLARDREVEPSPAAREAFGAIYEEQGRRSGAGGRWGRLVPEVVDPSSWLLDPFGAPDGRFGKGPAPPPRPFGAPPDPPRSPGPRLAEARLALLRVAEVEYLREIRGRPDALPAGELLGFEARLPDWYRATLDPLPSELARLRLRGLHRLALDDPELTRWLSTPPPGASRPSASGPAPRGAPRAAVTPF